MASLSDHIDRFNKNTRSITSTASQIAQQHSAFPGTFTRAVLSTHLGDLIRDIDPSELGLFRLVDNPASNTYDKGGRTPQDHELKRTEFSGATPLRKHTLHRDELKPEVYAHAALKYIDQYDPVRPMPRAYDQIVAILSRVNALRASIATLTADLEETRKAPEKAPPTKTRVEEEERRIKDLQARVAELSKLKDNSTKKRITAKREPTTEPREQRAELPKSPLSPSSPQEEKFWGARGEPSRTLRFSENLLDEEVNLGDMSTASFGSPLATPLPSLKVLGNIDLPDDPTITQFANFNNNIISDDREGTQPIDSQDSRLSSPDTSRPVLLDISPAQSPCPTDRAESKEDADVFTAEMPTAKKKKIKVNIEVERIISKIWSTVGDIFIPPNRTGVTNPLSVNETIAYLQQLSEQSAQPDSPIASSASSTSAEGSNLPTFQQIQYAHLLTMLLSASPHYSMPLNKVKENLAIKAKGSSGAGGGQGTTRVLFGCVAKRLVKIDRGGREQIVKFDI
ncbi:hypothetical protein M413DRAFT_333398 [Hebeloma cylindrosporum]|uniref:Uncharacterized protein n=1 Tax=Hebeloma cylindrosporum TaxID=76867 RepID=A0A0C2Y5S3_HEBCY|nr:hypothetical protein M413DRAFT_333398 [Hebeloma cylindrosporum h7]